MNQSFFTASVEVEEVIDHLPAVLLAIVFDYFDWYSSTIASFQNKLYSKGIRR